MTYRQQISAVKGILSACLQWSCLNNTEQFILTVTHKKMCTSNNPLIFHCCAPWTSRQLIIRLWCRTANHPLTPKARLEKPGHLSLKGMSLICGGNLERPHAAPERAYTSHTTLFRIRNALNLGRLGACMRVWRAKNASFLLSYCFGSVLLTQEAQTLPTSPKSRCELISFPLILKVSTCYRLF